jgi:hypothetical protein
VAARGRVAAEGRPILLGVDLTVRGDHQPQTLPPPVDTAPANGLEARRTGALSTRSSAEIAVTVSEGNEPVTDLQPSHGESGHAVVVRPGDLAMSHRHALPDSGSGPRLEFPGAVPEPGTYAVFVEFYRGEQQHIVLYTVEARR